MTLGPRGVAAATLIAVVAICGVAVAIGPMAAQALIGENSTASMPAMETVFTLVIFLPLVLAGIGGGALAGANAVRPGEHPLALALIGGLLGLAGVIVAVVSASVAGVLTEGAAPQATAFLLLWGAGVVLIQTGAEEVLFRGWLQPVLERAWGTALAIGITALAFAGLHVMGGARSPVTLVNLFLGGVMFGLLAAHGRGIAGALAAHFAWNGAEQLVLGLDPNPGIGSFGALLDLEMGGAQVWGGSDEGLNASLAMTVALVLIVIPLALVVRHRTQAKAKPKRLTID
ncbi:CPBP family intramembrane glutamic endopeptidase [Sphingomonas sp.]|uniref:CPBP family intramembrane glutamic endopeptidase n=1 Tax=Sphingomonas sp. TaxID=28214 RepID=UPI002DD647D5|nr:CPBP family intramembrane glutamic endopeptidase [Sphingomonas sp.]